ncbi:hypothetical protein TNIN_339961 [Trichonephila inaurata madagascariensis]|uniref:Uncharacterized protein n=1 Tax=Trichonephila inaurata madagascariensis TaxID=2747483 RepID=A0A8X7C3B6_9ARAC|nr:hypothetical protein TNIN_339961 [Trichonephila inaurata madagascariensis]
MLVRFGTNRNRSWLARSRLVAIEVRNSQFIVNLLLCVRSSDNNFEAELFKSYSKPMLNIKRLEIPLPIFRGRYEEWPDFKSQFGFTTNNSDLNELQKNKASSQDGTKLLETIDDSFKYYIKVSENRHENKSFLTETQINAI